MIWTIPALKKQTTQRQLPTRQHRAGRERQGPGLRHARTCDTLGGCCVPVSRRNRKDCWP
eukprot:4478631-Prorocentrum_lima.AAC.1